MTRNFLRFFFSSNTTDIPMHHCFYCLMILHHSRVRINLSDLNGGFDTDPCSFQHSLDPDWVWHWLAHIACPLKAMTSQCQTIGKKTSIDEQKSFFLTLVILGWGRLFGTCGRPKLNFERQMKIDTWEIPTLNWFLKLPMGPAKILVHCICT